jgi:hypothetical protein
MSTRNSHQRHLEEAFKLDASGKPVKAVGGMAQLRAENEALRNQIVSLETQWDMLKSTLGVLSTTVCTRESA